MFKIGEKIVRINPSVGQKGVLTVKSFPGRGRIELVGYKGSWLTCLFRVAKASDFASDIREAPFSVLTDDQKLVLVTAFFKGEGIQRKQGERWVDKEPSPVGGLGFGGSTIYRVKPKKTVRELKIEKLEATLAKMTLELEALKTQTD